MQTPPQLIRYLAFAAIALAVGAALVGSPTKKTRVVIDTEELARIVENEEDHVDALELAEWLRQSKPDLKVVDLRSKPEFDSMHISTAANLSIPRLDSALRLWKNQTIVLYSEGGAHSAQAWFLLKALGYPRVYFLKGGFNEWENEVLFPSFTKQNISAEEFQKRTEIAKFFGGHPRTENDNPSEKNSTPKKTKPITPQQKPNQQRARDPYREVC